MERYLRIRVEKLDGCRDCADGLEAFLRSLAGVGDAIVDADSGSIYAHYDPGRQTESRIRTAMRRAGYSPGPSIAY